MPEIIISIALIIIMLLLIILLIIYHRLDARYKELEDDYYNLVTEGFRNSNKMIMLEYYLRTYKEQHTNIYTLVRDIMNLVYNDNKK